MELTKIGGFSVRNGSFSLEGIYFASQLKKPMPGGNKNELQRT
jgi:hypothetical protein